MIRGIRLTLASMILLLQLAAVSPELHAWLHPELEGVHHACCDHHNGDSDADSDEDTHRCSVTLLAGGACMAGPVHLPAPSSGIWSPVDETDASALPVAVFWSPFARAPPLV